MMHALVTSANLQLWLQVNEHKHPVSTSMKPPFPWRDPDKDDEQSMGICELLPELGIPRGVRIRYSTLSYSGLAQNPFHLRILDLDSLISHRLTLSFLFISVSLKHYKTGYRSIWQ